MELIDIVQNKILDRRRMIFGNHPIIEYADYILEELRKIGFSESNARLATLIFNTKHDVYSGNISNGDAIVNLEYYAHIIKRRRRK